ncbi:NAD(P)-dependent oxidoreductase [Brachyspira catarrhinii]|uniref:NAD(P)-dependent oxidoreductase n=1 Tax=Brachyspira catarrhinii TaxID=2528966 RepID=A0ABY2TPS0_9SPIR|nr:NAD(P)-dependent oxidoreductase [Brachyspira catarrhinii]TKZ30179.1 NAD(P)-dependent oxidoreductase [Brachyspira catarrhinii]
MNNNCLIGYNGFVGSNILLKSDFYSKYNSKNINDIRNREFDLLICSAIPSDMQLANLKYKKDLENINELLNILKTVKSKKAVLISTIAVYPQPVIYDENDFDYESDSNYGKNRKLAEYEFSKIFRDSYIIRLPALFGNNLKKNFIFDIINPEPSFFTKEKFEYINSILKDDTLKKYYNYNKDTERYIFDRNKAINDNIRSRIKDILFSINETSLQFTNSNSRFQFYNLDNLYKDILKSIDNNINILNICSEPISAKEIMKNIFNKDFDSDKAKLYDYNMKSIYASKWNNSDNYLYNKDNIYSDLKDFFIKNGVL